MSGAPSQSTKKRKLEKSVLSDWQRKGSLNPRYYQRFPEEEEDEKGRGKIVPGLSGYGVWRRVPGWRGVLASSTGDVMIEGAKRVRKQSSSSGNYKKIGLSRGETPLVHSLVCRAFHGPALMRQTTDHGIKGVFEGGGDPSDNRPENLRWASPREQMFNQVPHKEHGNGRPCFLWKVGDEAHRVRYSSKQQAVWELGMNSGNLSRVLNPDDQAKTTRDRHGVQYSGCWVDTDNADLCEEVWKDAADQLWYKNLPKGRLYISNRGRTWAKHSSGNNWAHKRKPVPGKGHDYAAVMVGGKQCKVHVLVGELHFVGPRPQNFEAWDHIRSDEKWNNDITNLRPVTVSENRANRQ